MEDPSSPIDFDWDAIDAELVVEEEGDHVQADSSPHGFYDSIPRAVPDSIPHVVLDSTAHVVRDSTPNSVPDSAPNAVPDSTPNAVPDSAQQNADVAQQSQEQERDSSGGSVGYHSDDERAGKNRPGSMAVFNDVVKDTIERPLPDRRRTFPPELAKKPSYSGDVEQFSLLRIKDRVVPSAQVNSALSEVRFVRLQAIKTAMMCEKFQGSWATVGVIIEKGPTKKSVNGKDYAVWKLSTLQSSTLSLFLFGAGYTENCTQPVGTIVAVFNAEVRPDPKSKEPTMKIFSRDQIMRLGTSVDYSVCTGKRKDGSPCNVVLNKQMHGQFCKFHVTLALHELRSNRPELTGMKLELVGPGIRRGYRPKPPERSPVKNEVYKGPLKHITNSQLKDLLSDAEKMPIKSTSQGKRFLECMAASGVKEPATKAVKRQKFQETLNPKKRTPSSEKKTNTKGPGLKRNSNLPGLEKKPARGVVEIDTLDDMNDSMIQATSSFKR